MLYPNIRDADHLAAELEPAIKPHDFADKIHNVNDIRGICVDRELMGQQLWVEELEFLFQEWVKGDGSNVALPRRAEMLEKAKLQLNSMGADAYWVRRAARLNDPKVATEGAYASFDGAQLAAQYAEDELSAPDTAPDTAADTAAEAEQMALFNEARESQTAKEALKQHEAQEKQARERKKQKAKEGKEKKNTPKEAKKRKAALAAMKGDDGDFEMGGM